MVLIAALAAPVAGAFSAKALLLASRTARAGKDAYNPYCACTPVYGCAIPRKEDYPDLAITAGEKKWHD